MSAAARREAASISGLAARRDALIASSVRATEYDYEGKQQGQEFYWRADN